jgi:hypothetical protein
MPSMTPRTLWQGLADCGRLGVRNGNKRTFVRRGQRQLPQRYELRPNGSVTSCASSWIGHAALWRLPYAARASRTPISG